MKSDLYYQRALFLTCPTGSYCREDRCQSYFQFELVPSMRPPLEECEAAGVLKELGCDYKIIDSPKSNITEKDLLRDVEKFNPDLLVLAVTFGSLNEDLKWADKLKKILPKADICLRGAPCYANAEQILRSSQAVDFLLHGDYELVFLSLMRNGFEKADGCIHFDTIENKLRVNKRPYADNLDALPFPDRSAIDSKSYTVRGLGKPQATIRVQRGCPFQCTYCLVHTVTGNSARHRSPTNIVSEMNKLMREGIKHFYLRAETFTLDKRWAIAVSKAIAENCRGAKWVTTTRIECVDEEVLEAMREGGCYGISFGIDVVNEAIGAKVKKQPQVEKATKVMEKCSDLNIITLAYFMIGFIWETKETLREMAQAINKINSDLITIHFAHPYPGTKYEEVVSSAGFEVTSLKAQSTPAFQVASLSTKDLHDFSRKVLARHYLRPQLWLRLLRKGLFSYLRPRQSSSPRINALKRRTGFTL